MEQLDNHAKEYGCDSDLCYKMLDYAMSLYKLYPEENNLRILIDEWRETLKDIPDDAIGFADIRDECTRVLTEKKKTLTNESYMR